MRVPDASAALTPRAAGVEPDDLARRDEARLRQTARQLEGVFVEQLFKAMRETIPSGGLVDGGTGEEIFHSLLDAELSSAVPAQWNSPLGEALYRQLRASLNPSATAVDTPRVGGGEE
jgi:peptidoglycan hydrolase FlgJ